MAFLCSYIFDYWFPPSGYLDHYRFFSQTTWNVCEPLFQTRISLKEEDLGGSALPGVCRIIMHLFTPILSPAEGRC